MTISATAAAFVGRVRSGGSTAGGEGLAGAQDRTGRKWGKRGWNWAAGAKHESMRVVHGKERGQKMKKPEVEALEPHR